MNFNSLVNIFIFSYWSLLAFFSIRFYIKVSQKIFRFYIIFLFINLFSFWGYCYIYSLNLEIILLPILLFAPCFLVAKKLKQEIKKQQAEYLKISSENRSIQINLKLAKSIQESLFPKKEEFTGLKYDVFIQIQNHIGGDFFDFIKLREGNVGVFMTDVAGHGVSSAMVAAMIKVMVSTIPYHLKLDPAGLLTYLDMKMSHDYKSEHASAIYLYFDFPKRLVSFANAGHPYLIYQKKGQEFSELITTGSLLGYSIQTPIAKNQALNYSKGDRFFLYTDGLIEEFSSNGSFLGSEGLLKILNQLKDEPTESFKSKLLAEITFFYKKSLFTDDAMFLILEML